MTNETTLFNRRAEQVAGALSHGPLEFVPLHHADTEHFATYIHRDSKAWMVNEGMSPETYSSGITLQAALDAEVATKDNRCRLLVRQKGEKDFLGDVTIKFDKRHKEIRIGYFIVPSCRRQGLATQVADQMTQGLTQLAPTYAMHKIMAGVEPENTASIRVLEKAGFHHQPNAPIHIKGYTDQDVRMYAYPWSAYVVRDREARQQAEQLR